MSWTFLPAATGFARQRAAWAALNEAGRRSPLLDPDFVEPLLALPGHGTPVLAIRGEASAPQALLLLERQGLGRWRSFVPMQMPITPLVCQPGLDAGTLIGELIAALPALLMSLDLLQLDPQFDPRPGPQAGYHELDYIETARITIDAPFESWWAGRSKNLRQNLNKQRNRFEREGVCLRLECVRDPAGVAAAIADYGRLESAGWKSEGGTAVSPDNAQGHFYREVLERFCRRGQGRIYRYFYDDRLVTTDLCIEHAGTLVVLKTTYDESIQGSSPAMLMRQAYLAELFADPGLRTIEFYGRAMDWHRRLTDDLRTIYHRGYIRWPQLRRLVHWLRDARHGTASPRETLEHAETER